MKDRADMLRRRIEYYRRRLREGVAAEFAQRHLGQIAADRFELEQIEIEAGRRESLVTIRD